MKNYKYPVSTCTGDIIDYIEFSGTFKEEEEDLDYLDTPEYFADFLFRKKYSDIKFCDTCDDISVQLSEVNVLEENHE